MEGKNYLSTFQSYLQKSVREGVFEPINYNMERLRLTFWILPNPDTFCLFSSVLFFVTFSRSPWIYLMQFSAQFLYWLPLSLAGEYLK